MLSNDIALFKKYFNPAIYSAVILLTLTYSAIVQSKNKEPLFRLEKDISTRVYFWENIFLKYSSSTHVVHDLSEPWLIIDILPFNKLAAKRPHLNLMDKENQKKLTDKYLARYRLAIERFKSEGSKALNYGSMEKRIHAVYSQSKVALRKLYRGNVRIRYQQGLADTFIKASKRAQNFLPYVEKEFRGQAVPIELTRLAFVESMFNENAVSKVGASGMWQFMRSTAKQYLKVTRRLDERNHPIKSARAAAKLLRENYDTLGSWPLAVTAYNHGRAGMLRATSKTGTKNLAEIIKTYKKPSFGFASQNFYAEFLAALRAYNYLVKKNQINVKPSSLDLISVKLNIPLKLKNLSTKLNVPMNEIIRLNKCIKQSTIKKYKNFHLPKNYEIYLPRKYLARLNNKNVRIKTGRYRG